VGHRRPWGGKDAANHLGGTAPKKGERGGRKGSLSKGVVRKKIGDGGRINSKIASPDGAEERTGVRAKGRGGGTCQKNELGSGVFMVGR